jgi:hypothetical protein
MLQIQWHLIFKQAGFSQDDWNYTFNGVWGQGTSLYPATARDGVLPPQAFNATPAASPGLVSQDTANLRFNRILFSERI